MHPRGSSRAFSARAPLRASAAFADADVRALLEGEPDPSVAYEADLDAYLTRRFLPWGMAGERLVIATADGCAENLAWLEAAYDRASIASISPSDFNREIARRFGARLSSDAVYSLFLKTPELSAYTVITRIQTVALASAASAIAVAFWNWPYASAPILVAIMSAGFVISTAFRAALAFFGSRQSLDNSYAEERSPDEELPVYTILVPLFREVAVLPQLAASLSKLDYPREKLDIKFIVEEDDSETRAMAERLAGGGPFEVICVPYSLPRTKPKACNYALRFARGDYLVIYDAEDRPEPDQMRKAAAAFRGQPLTTACLQARLAIENAAESWLSLIFALDYAVWFKALLPGLDRFGVPMPLGGTSNHFRISVLREAGGWDPFNVTEDADLGIRLAQLGYRVSMLDSTTFEEAPAQLGPWLRQRSRWLKGYMQTWLVHAREPASLLERVGFRGVAVIQLFIGGGVWSALVNPLLWLIYIVSCAQPDTGEGLQSLETLALISGVGLLSANIMLAWIAIADSRRMNRPWVIFYGLSFIFYWALVSLAAYRGLWQLVFDPFYWEKTPHGAKRANAGSEA